MFIAERFYTLHDRLLEKMADEQIDIVDEQGKVTGRTCLKSEAHKIGIMHASVHVWIYNSQNEVLIQKRSVEKEIYPNLWDVSVAGHIGARESHLGAAKREVAEELGLELDENLFFYSGSWVEKHKHSNGLIDHEFHHIYTLIWDIEVLDLTLQREEVSEVKWISIENFRESFLNSPDFVPHDTAYYQWIYEILNR